MSLVNLENVGMSYSVEGNTGVIFENINLSITEGECLAIVGSSGSGKTTLLKLIAGLKQPTSGSIMFKTRKVEGPLDDVSVIFQDYGLFPWKTVEENMSLPLKLRGKNNRDKVNELMVRLGLTEQAKKYPCQLSGGQRQRVAIGRALLSNAKMILMDEPFSALDPITRKRMRKYVRELIHSEKSTAVIVTHSVKEAVIFGDRIAVFSNKGDGLKRIIENKGVRRNDFEGSLEYEKVKNLINNVMSGEDDET